MLARLGAAELRAKVVAGIMTAPPIAIVDWLQRAVPASRESEASVEPFRRSAIAATDSSYSRLLISQPCLQRDQISVAGGVK
jgi:hypothetical protein